MKKEKITMEKGELERRVIDKEKLESIIREDGWKVVERVFNETIDGIKDEMIEGSFKDISEVVALQKTIKKLNEFWEALYNVIDEGDEAIKILEEKYETY